MGEDITVTFVNCIGSDIDLWKKGPYDEDFVLESCLLYDDPEYCTDIDSDFKNTTWKFIDHITKRYLLGNGEKMFHFKGGERSMKVEIKTPLYTLEELCSYTITTRVFVNQGTINDLEIPNLLKMNLKNYIEKIEKLCSDDYDNLYDWTVYAEEEYNL